MHSLPLELIHEIARHSCESQDEAASKAPWSSIGPLSVACKAYRVVVLEKWFYILLSQTPSDAARLDAFFPQIYRLWTRELHVSPKQNEELTWDLHVFRRLHRVRFNHPSVSFPRTRTFGVFGNETPPTIVELELRHLPWPRPNVLSEIAWMFPQLEILKTTQRYIWCDLCFTCSNVQLAGDVPAKLVYTNGLGLPIHYARALLALKSLRIVRITVAYWEGVHIMLDLKDPYKDIWSGECDSCVGMLYGDPDFRDKWRARKRGIASNEDDSRKVYLKPPSLQLVEWVFERNEGAVDEQEEEAESGDDEDSASG